MNIHLFGLLERIHGHISVLGLAVLLHPVILLPRRKRLSRGTKWTIWLSIALISTAYAMGLWIYPDYRTLIKPRLIAENIQMAYLFESKEHLAFFCVVSVLGGSWMALRSQSASERKMAWVLLLCGWLCGALVAVLGILIAAA